MSSPRTWPQATRRDLQKFCRTEGWDLVRDARGRAVLHHETYELTLLDGSQLRTRTSRPPNNTPFDARQWSCILRDQLQVTEAEFWACVEDQIRPDRGAPEPPPEGVPVSVLRQLQTKVGLDAAEIAAMTKDEAIARLNKFWTESR
jgi:hypothetical protein